MKTSIWVVCFENPNEIGIHSKQLLCKASSLIKRDEVNISALCIGNYTTKILKSLSAYGADEVIYSKEIDVDYERLSSILVEIFRIESKKPKLIIFPATEWGKCIAADLAVKIEAGLTAECIDIEAQKGKSGYDFFFTRAAINSTVLAKIRVINTNVSMCTCKENAFIATEKYLPASISIREFISKIPKKPFRSCLLKSELILNDEKNMELENARIVFGIGRGIQDKNGLDLIERIAKKYNAAIAGTRAVVEEGFLDRKWQVGQSGISISPEIYVAIGISGATQHIVGIKNAKKIIAINVDKRAPIFSYANYCIIDDYKNIFNELL